MMMLRTTRQTRRLCDSSEDQRGAALVMVFVLTAVIAMFVSIALTHTSATSREVSAETNRIQALYLAEAGISAGLNQIAISRRTGAPVSSTIGSPDSPRSLIGDYWTTITNNGDDTFRITATGAVGTSTRTLEVIAAPVPPGPFEHSMFAGNFSGDSAYSLELGGVGSQADIISGDVYSGGDVFFNDDATLNGSLRAGGSITGIEGIAGVHMDLPRVLDIDYEQFNDHDVAELFKSSDRRFDSLGGWADQLGSSSPAHIFRRNPSDRVRDTQNTVGDDYFLEDPFEGIGVDWNQDGSDATVVTLPESANNSVFFIDGNLWLHNRRTLSLKLRANNGDPIRVTFVVKGNIYFSDNLFYDDPSVDGAAFIALSEEGREDSGNIYFGDPSFGTMAFAESMLFAENNFVDNNLSTSSNARMELRGNMTAGNQVAINRDFVDRWGRVTHTKLDLAFDPRQAVGGLNLPGLPIEADHPIGYTIAAWREIALPASAAPDAPTIQVPNRYTIQAQSSTPGEWRERWQEQFGDTWLETVRQGKWNSGSAQSN